MNVYCPQQLSARSAAMNISFRRAFPPLLLCLLLVFTVSGCEKTILDQSRLPQSVPPVAQDPLTEARSALAAGRYTQAEVAAQRAVAQFPSGSSQSAGAYEILAKAAAKNSHPNLALSALDQWRIAAPGADAGEDWQNVWCFALRAMGNREALSRSDAVYRDTGRSTEVRAAAAAFTAVCRFDDGALADAPAALEQMYANTTDAAIRRILERRLAMELAMAPAAARSLAASTVTPENESIYPYSIFNIDQLRRQSLSGDDRAAAAQKLRDLAGRVPLADSSLFTAVPSADFSLPSAGTSIPSGPITGRAVVLALPMGGQYAGISGKISAGAEAACKDLSATLVIIDTDQPDWTARIDGLPQGAAIVGGLLRTDDLNTAKTRGLLQRRAFFAFRPSVDGEGATVWRFFTSPEDQVNALLRFTSNLGIKGYASFYPDEPYGRRMAALFAQQAAGLGATSVHDASYNPSDPSTWLRATGDMLSANKNAAHSQAATFQAIFLPDSWKAMDVIVPDIFYYHETRQVLLGTTLWEQGLTGKPLTSPQYWNLAVFPGTWNPQATQGAAQRLQNDLLAAGRPPADLWSGLGYDFGRFAATLQVQDGTSPGAVNAALASFSMEWSTAPIHWDASGRASQELFLFTPSQEGGFAPVDVEQFRKTFSESWK